MSRAPSRLDRRIYHWVQRLPPSPADQALLRLVPGGQPRAAVVRRRGCPRGTQGQGSASRCASGRIAHHEQRVDEHRRQAALRPGTAGLRRPVTAAPVAPGAHHVLVPVRSLALGGRLRHRGRHGVPAAWCGGGPAGRRSGLLTGSRGRALSRRRGGRSGARRGRRAGHPALVAGAPRRTGQGQVDQRRAGAA